MNKETIIKNLPYTPPFLFVDELINIDENGVEGSYRFSEDLDFYQGHFKERPITPGVILTECCAQIGLVCLGLYLSSDMATKTITNIGMSSSQMEFLLPVLPNETVRVISKKVYFRFQKLKCDVWMYNANGALVCKGTLAGMLSTKLEKLTPNQ